MTRWICSGFEAPDEFTLQDFLNHPPPVIAVDIETISLKDQTLIGVGVAVDASRAFYFPCHPTHGGDDSILFQLFFEVFSRPDITKVLHNIGYDIRGLEPRGFDYSRIVDTRTLCWHLGIPASLKEAADGVLQWKIREIKDILPPRRNMLDLPVELVASKCLDDCRATWALWDQGRRYLPNHQYFADEMETLSILIRMGLRGVAVDQTKRAALEAKYRAEADYYRGLCDAEGFNPGSPQQVGYILMSRGTMLPMSYGKIITDEEALESVDDPLAAVVLNYRKAAKVLGTYLVPWSLGPRAHTAYHMSTGTGRTASLDFNLQNVPPDLRQCIIPDDNPAPVFTEWDYSQQEYRCLAYLSGDPLLNQWYAEGRDVHQMTADVMGGIPRRVAKNTGYAMTYGGDDATVAATAKVKDPRVAASLRRTWLDLFPVAGRWIEAFARQGLDDGYVTTLRGRRLYLPDVAEVGADEVKRKAVNYMIQGSCAEITKASIRAQAHLDLAITVHDSNLLNDYIMEEELRGLGLEDLGPFKVPIEVKHSRRWGPEV
jgi:DNA polymerase-1